MADVVLQAILPAAAFLGGFLAASASLRTMRRSLCKPPLPAPQNQFTLTATVTPAGLLAPPTCTMTGTAAPDGMPNGTCTCTAVTPGALATVLPTIAAGWPSIVTESAPARNCDSTPFTNNVSTLPWAAGCDAPLAEPSA